MAEILAFTGNTIIPDTPENALEKAKAWGMTRVVICGLDSSGELIFGGSHSEIPETLLVLSLSVKRLLEAADGPAS
jgi:hypothetical protein